ncbi:MAG TPA: carbamoyltransferase HypF [Gemmatimonadaceae bacterium]|nr:carbamoyltransferase HypF [Gemmatimonadaceae bacterium]
MSLSLVPSVTSASAAWVVSVSGVVQGVGFRPFVHRLAQRFSLAGWVRNVSGEVEMSVEGPRDALEHFVGALRAEAPPLARIDALTVVEAVGQERDREPEFRIIESRGDLSTRQLISPDIATCAECEHEFMDPGNRRAGYAFITCTNCGPRHSLIESMPYDRERTTMRAFELCAKCAREYHDISDRRYHSETNSCWACGPRVTLLAGRCGRAVDSAAADPIDGAATLLRQGGIVAVRGIGGFHLAADGTSEGAVLRLRERKRRDGKPFAVMVRSLPDARDLAWISDAEAKLLTSPERPIVVLNRRPSKLAAAVSDGLRTVGIMLAYSPLHMRLLDLAQRPLVMTSGNPASLPLAVTLADARDTLGAIADAFLTHDRDIVAPIDDSVVRVVNDETVMMRRARGYAPLPVPLPVASPDPLLAVGAHLKNTFTLAEGADAFVSQHIGDLETLETKWHWDRSRAAFSRMLRIEPRVVVRDLHPEYLSTRLARSLGHRNIIVVQHHHAHIAAVAAEHGVTDNVVGLAFDGTGFGADEAIWGSEFLVADLATYRRVGQLRYAPLPGGDAAARQGWRATVGYASLADAVTRSQILDTLGDALAYAAGIALRQCERGLNAPKASSMGRLFDAAAAILGVCSHSRYEGEAAMRLESLALTCDAEALPLPIVRAGDRWVLDPVPLLADLAVRRQRGADIAMLAAAFHESIAAASAELAARIAAAERLDTIALGGGVFQNAKLLLALRRRLSAAGLRVLTAKALPPNDGAISYGQAAVAATRLALAARAF